MSAWRRTSPPVFGRCAARANADKLQPFEEAMIGLLQRVADAAVEIDGRRVAAIGPGLLVLVGVRPADDEARRRAAARAAASVSGFRGRGRKDELEPARRSGAICCWCRNSPWRRIPHKGLRPGFSTAAPPEQGRRLFDVLVSGARAGTGRVESGVFGAHMQVSLTNDGPVTFWLES